MPEIAPYMNPIASFVIPSVVIVGERTPDLMVRQLKDRGCSWASDVEKAIRRLPCIPRQHVYPFEFRTNSEESETIEEFRERRKLADSPPLSEVPPETALSLAIALSTTSTETLQGRQVVVGSPPMFNNGRAHVFSILCTRMNGIVLMLEPVWQTKPLARDSIWFFGAPYPTLP